MQTEEGHFDIRKVLHLSDEDIQQCKDIISSSFYESGTTYDVISSIYENMDKVTKEQAVLLGIMFEQINTDLQGEE